MSDELHIRAREHVRRVLRDTPEVRDVDGAAFVAFVVAHLQPLAPDRPFRRPAVPCRRGEPVWVGGAVGLHVPPVREAS